MREHLTHSMSIATCLITLAVLAARTTGAEPVVMEPDLESLKPPVLLPDGQEFKTWRPGGRFTRTYYVDRSHAKADDAGPGTQEKPFKTINRAAQVLHPGQRVLVAPGVYRERVTPKRGGTSPAKMIRYQASGHGAVVIKGSRVLKTTWKRIGDKSPVWTSPLPAEMFDGPNPFALPNVTPEQFSHMSWATRWRGKTPYTLPRGLVFQDGKRLAQVAAVKDLAAKAGTYWVGEKGKALQIRPFDDTDPNDAVMEVTTQGMVFAPEQTGLGYIAVAGFTIEHAGNQWPMPQHGALSTTGGHHWLIEHNTVREVNGVGIDIGTQRFWDLPRGMRDRVGKHIVRRNAVTDCGVCGIQGLSPTGSLIEDNHALRNAFHDVAGYYETGGIKTHTNRNVLIRRNVVMDTIHGSGIWMDFANANSRCTQNVVVGNNCLNGAIFVEASNVPNMVDHNFIWGNRGEGIYEHDSCGQIFVHNFIGRNTGPAIRLRGKATNRRVGGKPIVGGDHTVANNIFFDNKGLIVTKDKQADLTNNLADGVKAAFDRDTMTLTWQVTRDVARCTPVKTITHDFTNAPRGGKPVMPGPLVTCPTKATATPLSP